MEPKPEPKPSEGQVWATLHDSGMWQGFATGEGSSGRGWETSRVSTVIRYPQKAEALQAAVRLAVFMWGPIPLTVRRGE